MKLLGNWKYHVLTLLYFAIMIFFTLTLKKLIFPEIFSKNLVNLYIFEFFLITILLYVISLLITPFLEKIKPNEPFTWNNFWILLFLILFHIAFQLIIWYAFKSKFVFKLIHIDPNYDFPGSKTYKHHIINYLFFLSYNVNWVVFVYTYRIYQETKEHLNQKLTLEKNLKEANLNTLKGQVNPHFIFNSLNNIRGLVLENPVKSREMITRLSEVLRSSLLSNNNNTVTLEEEMETVDNFLEISKIQYEDRLNYQLEISPETKPFEIPPMIVQMLVENAVKHGIANLKNGGNVLVKSFLDNEKLTLIVKNSGKFTQNENSTKIGLKNIEERLKLMYGENASFNISEENEEVTAKIIIKKAELNT